MITSVVLGALTLKCDGVDKPEPTRTAILQIPGRDGDIIQNLGKSSMQINLTGILDGASLDANKATLEGYKGTTQTYNDGVDNITVYVSDVNVPTQGGKPDHYNFTARLIKYDQT